MCSRTASDTEIRAPKEGMITSDYKSGGVKGDLILKGVWKNLERWEKFSVMQTERGEQNKASDKQ